MMNKILLISGKKQSGKSTLSAYVQGLYYAQKKLIYDNFQIYNGKLLGYTCQSGDFRGFKGDNPDKNLTNFFPESSLRYSFADPVKKMMIGIFGLRPEQVYGNENNKNSLTNYLWENMPDCPSGKTGRMTSREMMIHVGTKIFRKMDFDIWAKAGFRECQEENPELSVFDDCRFPNEFFLGRSIGARTIRLTRNIFPDEVDESETAMDRDKFDWGLFDAVLDNSSMTEAESYLMIHLILKDWGWLN